MQGEKGSNSNIYIGVEHKKDFGKHHGETPSLHPQYVSCSYGESTKIPSNDGASVQARFPNPPFDDLDFILVGLGKKGENCGVIFASHICENLECMKVHYSKQRCLRRACPECYRKWLVEERENIIARLISEEAIKKNKGRRLVEITVSPDPKKAPIYRYEFDRLVKEGYQYIKKKGVRGGCTIIHPFRATSEAKRLSWELHEKTWDWIRKQEKPEEYFYYSPHLHLLAYTNHLSEPKRGEEWIYKTRTEDKTGHVINFLRKAKRKKTLRDIISYFLSHTGTLRKEEGKFHSVRWFGSCSYNKFGTTAEEIEVKEEHRKEELRCKICGEELTPFWKWVRTSYGDVYRDIINNVLDPPKYWEEVMSAVGKEDPPPDAEKYLVEYSAEEERERKSLLEESEELPTRAERLLDDVCNDEEILARLLAIVAGVEAEEVFQCKRRGSC